MQLEVDLRKCCIIMEINEKETIVCDIFVITSDISTEFNFISNQLTIFYVVVFHNMQGIEMVN